MRSCLDTQSSDRTWLQRLKRVFEFDDALMLLKRGQDDREHRRSRGDQANPRSSRAAGRGRDPCLQTLRPRATATRITGPEGTRLTADPSLTHGCEAGLTPGSVSLAAVRPRHHNFRSDSAFSATIAPRSHEMPWSTAIIHGDQAD